jgi:hypothetical protein
MPNLLGTPVSLLGGSIEPRPVSALTPGAGIGSTLVVARDLKRWHIGIEPDKNHAQTASDRAYERRAQQYSERL